MTNQEKLKSLYKRREILEKIIEQEDIENSETVEAIASYKIANIRKLLNAVFNDEDLTDFCQDNFSTVFDNFSTGMSKNQKIRILLDFSKRNLKFALLLKLIKEINSEQYQKFVPYW